MCKTYKVLDCVHVTMSLREGLGFTFGLSTEYSRYVDYCEMFLLGANLLYL